MVKSLHALNRRVSLSIAYAAMGRKEGTIALSASTRMDHSLRSTIDSLSVRVDPTSPPWRAPQRPTHCARLGWSLLPTPSHTRSASPRSHALTAQWSGERNGFKTCIAESSPTSTRSPSLAPRVHRIEARTEASPVDERVVEHQEHPQAAGLARVAVLRALERRGAL